MAAKNEQGTPVRVRRSYLRSEETPEIPSHGEFASALPRPREPLYEDCETGEPFPNDSILDVTLVIPELLETPGSPPRLGECQAGACNPDDPREGPICTELPGHIVFRDFARFRLGDLGACVATEESLE